MSDRTEQNIFNAETNTNSSAETQEPSAANTQPTSQNPLDTLLQDIKNERGEPKYKTVEDALIGLKHAQEFIPKVKEEKSAAEKELADLREELNRLKGLEETVFELTQRKEQTSTNGVALNEEDIAKLVERTLTSKQQEELYKKNQQTVVSTLTEKFGKEAENVFYGKAQELGLSVEEMNTLASKNPKAALTLLGVTETVAHKQTSVSPSPGAINSEGFRQEPQTFLGREEKGVMIGATTADLLQSVERASRLAEELREKGLSTYDLTDPKVYNKFFK
jgi:hypothetical protein